MAYKAGTVIVTSVPLSNQHNEKLNELAKNGKYKSRTQLGKRLLEGAIDAEYNNLIKHGGKE